MDLVTILLGLFNQDVYLSPIAQILASISDMELFQKIIKEDLILVIDRLHFLSSIFILDK